MMHGDSTARQLPSAVLANDLGWGNLKQVAWLARH